MRRFDRLHSWTLLFAALIIAGGVLAFLETHSGAATGSLWSDTPPTLASGQTPWVAVAKADTAAVVNISTTQVVKNPMAPDNQGNPNDPFQEFFRQFMGNMPRTYRTHSLGSGFIVRPDGYIVTNNHVVDGATDITVKLSGDRHFTAKVVGRDPKTDLALLKIDAQNLPSVAFGDSDKLQVGEPVMAIGNPFGLEGTVTTGIVSAKGRVIGEGPYDDFIQTDALINPGNSGGPLVNQAGQVVGIDTAIVSQSGGSVGIGFAIPINEAKTILPQLEAKGHVTRGWLGVSLQPMTAELAKAFKLEPGQGALVADVMPNSPAAKAGLKTGDVITEYDGHTIAKGADITIMMAEFCEIIAHGAKPRITVEQGFVSAIICLCIEESCPPEEKLFRADEVHMYLTPMQARQLGLALVQAAKLSADRGEEQEK